MRTTVTIDDALLAEVKELALRKDRTVGSVLEDAIRMLLNLEDEAGERTVSLTTYGGGGLRPGVDLEDKDALYELLDQPPDERDQD